jgi:6-phosphofructokinase 2
MKPIATLTMNPAIDAGTETEQVLAEKKIRCAVPHFEPGGGGVNVSRAIRKLGGESTALFTSGGVKGELYRSMLEAERLQVRPLPVSRETRENLTVLEISSGRQYRFGMPGPELSEQEWRDCLSEVANLNPRPGWLVLSGSLPPGVPHDFYARLIRLAGDWDAKVILDTSGEPLRRSVEEGGIHLIKPNLREFSQLAGLDTDGPEESRVEQAALELVGRGKCRALAISLGAGGVLLIAEGHVHRFRSPTVPIRSKIGAGDSMTAGLTLKLAQGWSLPDAVRYGVASGAAAVMTPGSELCRLEDTERLYRSTEWN